MLKRLLTLITVLIAVAMVAPVVAQDGEIPVQRIELTGPAATPDAEISGLAWYGDMLILLVENPNLYATEGNAGMIFALAKADILAYLDAESPAPLEPTAIPVIAPDLVTTVPGFDGFEAITFVGDQAYLMIEAEQTDATMIGYLVTGTIAPDLGAITLDLENRIAVPAETDFNNMFYESLLAANDQLFAFYEINGAAVNPAPMAQVFDPANLEESTTTPFPALEYRLTDVTGVDDTGIFWGINYFFPGDDFMTPASDPIAEQFGEGATHTNLPQVERLIAFQVADDGRFQIAPDLAPIQLELPEGDSRNWEGIERLEDRGFLLVTDKYPETILAFVPYVMNGEPAAVATAEPETAAAGDPAAGEVVFTEQGCIGCHAVTDGVGPALTGMSERAGTRMEGMAPADYLHQSIMEPSAFVVEGYPDVMPHTYGETLTDQQISDLIAYLLTQ
jgi:mono/diheme cytochrome c family protein